MSVISNGRLSISSASGCPIANRHKLQRQQAIANGLSEAAHHGPSTILNRPIKMDGLK